MLFSEWNNTKSDMNWTWWNVILNEGLLWFDAAHQTNNIYNRQLLYKMVDRNLAIINKGTRKIVWMPSNERIMLL